MEHDLADDWEFKILRSTSSAFRHRHNMEQALREEADAGWVLLEKLDNSRLRLKRPRSSSSRNGNGAIDPYRSYYGLGPGTTALVATTIAIAAIFGLLALVITLK